MADEDRIVFYAAGGFFFGLWLFFRGFKTYRLKKLIEHLPTSKVRSIAMGMVEIAGKAVPAEKKSLKSPFTSKDCVYYKYTVEEYRSSGKSSHWVTIKSGDSCMPFFLQDDTGKVLVDPKGAEIDIPMDNEFKSRSGYNPPKEVMTFLVANRLNHKNILGFNKMMRYREYYLAPNDPAYVLGTAGDNPFVEEGTGASNADDIMIQKGKSGDFYYISDSGEKAVLSKISGKAYLQVFGGGALSVVCLAVIFWYFRIL